MNGDIREYIQSLIDSKRLGPQVVHHRVLPGSEPAFSDPVRPWSRSIKGLIRNAGIDNLYTHQALAADLIRSGRNVVVATPTASGKTLTYNLPFMEQVLADPSSKALYLFPLKALAQDQLKGFESMASLLPEENRPTARIFDGDTTPHFRRKIRDNPPNALLTNPEMLHLSLLPYHENWASLFANLTHIVVDEVHTYRGVMGSHMAMLFRRLLRVCRHWGSDPTFVFCSATVGNPGELCHNLTGLDASEVLESGAGQGKRHFVFLNPHDSPSYAAIMLLQAALSRGLRTIVYTRSRKMTELISVWAGERSGEYRDRISSYRAGYLPEERREIEARMASGDLLAVISTSALELGIDIGGLDLCILVGYPGSVMATLQRGGRVGRSGRESAVALIGGEDALDQYFMRHPEDFFTRPPESAVVNPHNEVIMSRHMVCAAAELTLRHGEPFLAEKPVQDHLKLMLDRCELFQSETEEIFTQRKRPHREVDLRGSGRTMLIQDSDTGKEIGQVDMHRAFKETHPGAVYLHLGKTWLIKDLDLETGTVRAKQERVGYYTRVRASKSTEILEIIGQRMVCGTRMCLGRLRVTEQISGYEKRAVRGGIQLGIVPLELPPLVFETEGLWFVIPDQVRRNAEDKYMHFMGGIHALEHAAIGIMPLLVLTDRNDLGGISTPFHEQVKGSAVFIYDGLPGGAGLARQGFAKAEDLFRSTLKAIRDCECELGCPSCVHSPKCGSGNRPIDKASAIFLLEEIVNGRELKLPGLEIITPEEPESKSCDNTQDFCVLDVETRRSAKDVGGWHRADRMGVSVVVVYDSVADEYVDFPQNRIKEMWELVASRDLVIGFNINRFDYKVLRGVHPFDVSSLNTLDLLDKVKDRLSYRVSLDNLAQATLGVGKSADGLQALEWWKEGRLDLITQYCQQDVKATLDLYIFGRDNGHLFFTNKDKRKVKLPISW